MGQDKMTTHERVLPSFELDDAGIPYRVTLNNAVIADIDAVSGEIVAMAIPHFDSLMASIAIIRCQRAEKLNGADLRFLRRVLDLSAKDFAGELKTNAATLSRWEAGKQPIGEAQERLIRLYVCERLAPLAPAIEIDRICIMQVGLKAAPPAPCPLHFSFNLQTVRDRQTRETTQEWDELPEAA